MSREELDDLLPHELRVDIAAGRAGVTPLVGPDRHQPATLVCVAPADRLQRLSVVHVAAGASAASAQSPRGRLVILRIGAATDDLAGEEGEDAAMSLGIDLGHAEGRDLVARMARDRGFELLRVPLDGGDSVDHEAVLLAEPCARALRSALMHAGEWHVEAPEPLGFSERDWRELVRAGPGPRLFRARGVGDLVMAVAPASAFRGVDLGRRPVEVGSALLDCADWMIASGADLELRFAAPAGGIGRIALSLADGEQRRTAEQLSLQPGLAALSLSDGPTPSLAGCVRLTLTAEARDVVSDATSAADRRAGP